MQERTQRVGERPSMPSALTLLAGKGDGEADHDPGDGVVPDDPGDGFHVLWRTGVHGSQRDGDRPPVVADGHADPGLPEVEAEDSARLGHARRIEASRSS